ncbi:hypothetical protein Tco_1077200, partial [Tanacetum coccineum]
YQGLEYTDEDITDFEERMRMEHCDDAGVVVFTSRAWGRLFDTRGPLSKRMIPGKGDLQDYRMMAHSIAGRSQAPEKFDDTWAWVAMGPDRQPNDAAGAPAVVEDAPAVDEGDLAVLAPVQSP